MKLFERPDHAFGVVLVKRFVVVVKVHPAGLPGDVATPVLGVFQDRCFAELIEFGDAILLDLWAARDSKKAFGLHLRGKSVSVPAKPALHPVAAHRLVARNKVLCVTGQQVPVVRQTIGERWAVVEDVLLGTSVGTLVD